MSGVLSLAKNFNFDSATHTRQQDGGAFWLVHHVACRVRLMPACTRASKLERRAPVGLLRGQHTSGVSSSAKNSNSLPESSDKI